MKNLLFAILLLISPFSMADAWDNLTMEQAKSVVAELKRNPYIFDYCDCCDHSGEYATKVHLLKVTNTEIVTCSWSPEHYSVEMDFDVIAELKYTSKGLNTKKMMKPKGDAVGDVFFMNYTWGLNTTSKLSTPFFNIVEYDMYGNKAPCRKDFAYPSPKAISKVSSDPGYANWYKENISQ